MNWWNDRREPRALLNGPASDYDLENNLREALVDEPPSRRRNEIVPQPDYSIERAESFLNRHLGEIATARATLAVEVAAAEAHLAELKRRVGVTTIVHDALAETLAKLSAPKQEQVEEGFPS